MEYEEIVPAPGELKATLQLLHSLAGGHADAVTNGHYEIIVPAELAQKYRDAVAISDDTPKRRTRRTKKELEEQ